jgi:hypothetical protein
MASDAGDNRERHQQQQRELEEIRRSFQEVGIRMGSMFEPEPRNGATAEQPSLPAPAPAAQPPAKGRPTWMLALVVAACLLIGGGLGYLLHHPTADTANWPTVTVTSIVTRSAPADPQTKLVAPSACLQTAQRADEMIDLFTRNIRDRRLSLALKAYTTASQACRKEASP